ncbi:MAG: hypothetical protein HY660_04450 [Armatimonadetes bacterium]|nr:hypothetical protein [Armatimonadota bacterium]
MLDLFGDVLRTLVVYPDAMRARLREGWSTASHLADVLAREGNLPFRGAHRVVARLVRLAAQRSLRPDQVDAAILEEAAHQVDVQIPPMDTTTLRRHLDAEEFVRTRVTEGSQHPDEVRRVLDLAAERLRDEEGWLADRRRAVAAAEAELRRAIQTIAG